MFEHLKEQAQVNLEALRNNSYPGRGLVLGLNDTGDHLVQAYWIMGRSKGSRNRVFVAEDEGRSVRTALADPSGDGGNTELTIYRAMAEATRMHGEKVYVVSNGSQTDAVINGAKREAELLYEGLEDWRYEPDDPNFTPRITGLFILHIYEEKVGAMAEILIHKRSPVGNGGIRVMHKHDCPFETAGIGLCVTTYVGDGKPLPAFTGEPYPLPLPGGIEEVSNSIWDTLDSANRVALAVKFIEQASGKSQLHIINQYEQVPT